MRVVANELNCTDDTTMGSRVIAPLREIASGVAMHTSFGHVYHQFHIGIGDFTAIDLHYLPCTVEKLDIGFLESHDSVIRGIAKAEHLSACLVDGNGK